MKSSRAHRIPRNVHGGVDTAGNGTIGIINHCTVASRAPCKPFRNNNVTTTVRAAKNSTCPTPTVPARRDVAFDCLGVFPRQFCRRRITQSNADRYRICVPAVIKNVLLIPLDVIDHLKEGRRDGITCQDDAIWRPPHLISAQNFVIKNNNHVIARVDTPSRLVPRVIMKVGRNVNVLPTILPNPACRVEAVPHNVQDSRHRGSVGHATEERLVFRGDSVVEEGIIRINPSPMTIPRPDIIEVPNFRTTTLIMSRFILSILDPHRELEPVLSALLGGGIREYPVRTFAIWVSNRLYYVSDGKPAPIMALFGGRPVPHLRVVMTALDTEKWSLMTCSRTSTCLGTEW